MNDLRSVMIRLLMNKYFIAFMLFVIYLLFFDRYNIPSQWKRYHELKELERYRAFYVEEIETNDQALQELNSGIEAKEKYARETYFMKRDNEDVFIIQEPSED